MLRSLVVTNNATGETRTFNVNAAYSDSVRIHSIDGLDPADATVLTTQYADVDGMVYQGTVIPGRNVVLTLKLEPKYATESVESLRDDLYILFQQKGGVRLTCMTDRAEDPEIYVDGFVDKIPTPYFTADPIMQVSIVCPSPYLTSVNSDQIDISLDEATEYIAEFDIRGTAPAPYELRIPLISGKTLDQVSITFRSGLPSAQNLSVVGANTTVGQYVSFRNIPGKRAMTAYVSEFNQVNLLGKLQPNGDWPDLIPKSQKIAAFVSYTDFVYIRDFSLLYTPRFLGA